MVWLFVERYAEPAAPNPYFLSQYSTWTTCPVLPADGVMFSTFSTLPSADSVRRFGCDRGLMS